MNTAQVLVRCLENEGVQYVFGLPGEENLEILEALRTSPIKLITTRHEATAGFMAAAYGRLTGKPGVCLTTLGPGVTNVLTALAHAQLGGMPLVLISAQKNLFSQSQGRFQLLDTMHLTDSLSKGGTVITTPSQTPSAVREAFRVAQYERPGVYHIQIPQDVASAVAGEPDPLAITELRRPVADAKPLAQAIHLIEQARRPVIIVGPGANRQRVTLQLEHLIQQFGIPVLATPMGKGIVDERLPQYLGTLALSEGDLHHSFLEQADVIIHLGHDVTEKPPYYSQNQTIIDIDFTPAEVTSFNHPAIEVLGDIAHSLTVIREHLQPVPGWDLAFFESWREQWRAQVKTLSDIGTITPLTVVTTLREVMPAKGIVSLDNGLYKIWFARHYMTYKPNTLLLDNALATMGAGLGTAITASLVLPELPVTAVIGDGGMLMSLSDLGTAVDLNCNLTIIVLRDEQYGMVRWKQQSHHLKDFAMDVPNPDWRKVAEGFGLSYDCITNPRDLRQKLERTVHASGVHFIEIPLEYTHAPIN